MNFNINYSIRLFIWSIIFGFALGLFGISLSIIRIADFYLKEGANTESNRYLYCVQPQSNKPLNSQAVAELQNIAGIENVYPYITPKESFEGSINYFGFSASYPIQIKGLPKELAQLKAEPQYQDQWNSVNLDTIPVLIPNQALNIYNNIAPSRGWPILPMDRFLGLPGLKLKIGNQTVNVIITGFDNEDLGTTIIVPAEKLNAIFEKQQMTNLYDKIEVETIPGISKKQARDTIENITKIGYDIDDVRTQNFQAGLFFRIKITLSILGFGILAAFILLKFFHLQRFFSLYTKKIWMLRIWGIKNHFGIIIIFWTIVFSILCGFLTWLICFFIIIPAQDYIVSSLMQFGINTPDIKVSARTAIESSLTATGLFATINLFSAILFYNSIPKADFIKKF
ncbi:MAG: hypothetical protein ACRCTQ_00965 [Brevinemataceae bacterium]